MKNNRLHQSKLKTDNPEHNNLSDKKNENLNFIYQGDEIREDLDLQLFQLLNSCFAFVPSNIYC